MRHNLAPLTKPFAVGFDDGFELEELRVSSHVEESAPVPDV